jgi:hypothetical protein
METLHTADGERIVMDEALGAPVLTPTKWTDVSVRLRDRS